MKPVVLVVRKFDDNLQEENFMTASFFVACKPQKNEQTTWKTQKKKLVNFLSE